MFAAFRSNVLTRIARAGSALAILRDEVSASLNPQTEADLRLVDQQLTIARQSSWTTTFILPFAAVAISYANRGWAPLNWLITWPILVAFACIGTDIYFRLLLKRVETGYAEGIRARARTFAGMTIITSAAWSSMVVLLWAPGEPVNHMFLVLVVASSVSGWSSLGASHLATALAPMPIYLGMQIIMPFRESDPLDLTLAVLGVLFWIIMTGLLYANYKMRERMLRLENERGALIHDLRRAKSESDEARERAETASRTKSSFLANMSHELRTPLNAILGFSEIIHTRALGASAQDQYSEYGGFIHDSGKHLLSLINDILDLAKIEAGRLTLREEEVDLARLISESVQMLSRKAQTASINLTADTPPALPNVYGDERALRQIIVNLLSNAVKFTPPAGMVSAFAGINADGSMRFGVVDTGIGIEKEDQARVFESFGQGRHDAVIADQGTGLGLPIVRGLAEAHDGTVSLKSAPGKGTCVTVTLPVGRLRKRRTVAAA